MNESLVVKGYEYAKQVYNSVGVDVDAAMQKAAGIPISMHCWQGDDVIGSEGTGTLTGGIQTTGNYPGKARNVNELRNDIDFAMKLIPGTKKINLHACYPELGNKKIDRDEYSIDDFSGWVDWAQSNDIGLDFNPTYFSHKMMDGDFSLASRDEKKRRFWIEHGKRCREISEQIGKRLNKLCVCNFWMPDGYKDLTADTAALRKLMIESLDEIFKQKFDEKHTIDALESKLFGIGVESYTVASHEFSLAYALTRGIAYTLDAGHFHPTELVSAKLSSVLSFCNNVLLHVSRGIRWDSDHVVTFDDELQTIMNEIVRNGYLNRVFIGLDYFDASINRIAAWVIGMRNSQRALLKAMCEPFEAIRTAELDRDYTSRLALIEESKTLPHTAVWDYYCMKNGIPVGQDWLCDVKKYEKEVLSKR